VVAVIDSPFICPSCGERTDSLHQGYCWPCLHHRQDAHLLHIAAHDRWQRMSPAEREREIRDAASRG
jgi:transposase